MSTGTGIQGAQPIVTSDITPSVSLPSNAGFWDTAAKTAARFDQAMGTVFERHYAEVGAQEGAAVAAGTQPYKKHLILTQVGAAREQVFQASYLAGIRSDIDAHEQVLRRDNAYDPVAYKAAADKAVSGFIQGAPGPYAVQVEQYAKDKTQKGYEQVANARLVKDQTEAQNTIAARETSTENDLLDIAAAPDGESSPAFKQKLDEWKSIQDLKVANPLFAYTQEQSDLKAGALLDKVAGTVITAHASQEYAANGGGEHGKLAALEWLQLNVLRQPVVRPAPAAVAHAAPQASGANYRGIIEDYVSMGARVTSAFRTPAENAKVGGAAGSHHMDGSKAAPGAYDLVPAKGQSLEQLHASLVDAGFPAKNLLIERAGDPHSTGDHLHVTIPSGAPTAPAAPPAAPAQAATIQPDGPDPFENAAPGKREKYYRQAVSALNDLDRADAERRALLAQQDRAARQDRRDNAGDLAFDLITGKASEADVKQAVADDRIDEYAGAKLISQARADDRRQATADRAADTAAQVVAYGPLALMASDGTLTMKDLAAHAKEISPLQLVALRAKVNKLSRPVHDQAMNIVKQGLHDAGVTGASQAVLLPQIEADAGRWALDHPNAQPGEIVSFAEHWLKSTKGIAMAGTSGPKPGAAGKLTYPQFAAKYREKFHGQNPSKSDVDNAWKRYSGSK